MINSETIRIQVRDRFKSEVVISEESLTRYIDYTIDYDRGTLIFKQPVPYSGCAVQSGLHRRRIRNRRRRRGGRNRWWRARGLSVRSGDSEIGVTYVHDGASGTGGDLGGADLQSGTAGIERADDGSRVDRHRSARIGERLSRAGGTQAAAISRGARICASSRRTSAWASRRRPRPARAKSAPKANTGFQETWLARLDAFQQTNLVADRDRNVAESALVYRHGSDWKSAGGFRAIREEAVDGTTRDANQMTLGSTRTLDDGRWKLNNIADIDLGGAREQRRLPDAADDRRRIQDRVRRQPHRRTGVHVRRRARHAEHALRHQGATVDRLQRQRGRGISSGRERANACTRRPGLAQTWQVNEHWRLDFGMDRVQTIEESGDAEDPDALTYNPNVPITSGSIDDDFSAAFFGFGYRQADWDATSRIEYHHGEQVDKWNLLAGASRQLDDGKVVSGSFALLESQQSDGTTTNQGDLRFGAAWRPLDSDWAFLNRLDLVFNENKDDTFDTTTRKLVENMNANYAPAGRWQLALQFGPEVRARRHRRRELLRRDEPHRRGVPLRPDATLGRRRASSVLHSFGPIRRAIRPARRSATTRTRTSGSRSATT